MEKQNKSTGKTALIAVLLLVAVAAIIFATYAWAKYTETFNGNATAQVAKWNVEAQFDSESFTQTYTHVLNKRMAPGTQGSVDVTANIHDTDVDVDYKVVIDSVTVAYADNAPAEGRPPVAAIPQNMKFACKAGAEGAEQALAISDIKAGTVLASGRLVAGSEDKTTLDIPDVLTWEWPYQSYEDGADESTKTAEDKQDTDDGKYPVTITLTYKIIMDQVKPEAQPAP